MALETKEQITTILNIFLGIISWTIVGGVYGYFSAPFWIIVFFTSFDIIIYTWLGSKSSGDIISSLAIVNIIITFIGVIIVFGTIEPVGEATNIKIILIMILIFDATLIFLSTVVAREVGGDIERRRGEKSQARMEEKRKFKGEFGRNEAIGLILNTFIGIIAIYLLSVEFNLEDPSVMFLIVLTIIDIGLFIAVSVITQGSRLTILGVMNLLVSFVGIFTSFTLINNPLFWSITLIIIFDGILILTQAFLGGELGETQSQGRSREKGKLTAQYGQWSMPPQEYTGSRRRKGTIKKIRK